MEISQKIKCFFGFHRWDVKDSGVAAHSFAHSFCRYECAFCLGKKEREFMPNGDIKKRNYWTEEKNEY